MGSVSFALTDGTPLGHADSCDKLPDMQACLVIEDAIDHAALVLIVLQQIGDQNHFLDIVINCYGCDNC